jgi:hypothetical protein
MICSSVKRFFMSNLLYVGLDSKLTRYSIPGGRHLQRIIHFNTKVSDGAFQPGVPKQQLNCSQVFGSFVDLTCKVILNPPITMPKATTCFNSQMPPMGYTSSPKATSNCWSKTIARPTPQVASGLPNLTRGQFSAAMSSTRTTKCALPRPWCAKIARYGKSAGPAWRIWKWNPRLWQ